MEYAPFVRIFLRYILGGAFFGAAAIGDKLAADPDFVMVASLALGALVEFFYAVARKKGGAT